MPTIYEPAKKTLGDLLGDPSRKTSVPDYQRDYSWTDGNIEYFWQDILDFMNAHPGSTMANAEYFIGSMVRVERESGYELLDGQQRLVTAVILLSAIRDKLAPLNEKAAQRTDDKWIVDHDDLSGDRRYSLTLSRYDRDYFRRRIQDSGCGSPEPATESQRLIDGARKKFDSEIEAILNGITDEKAQTDWLLRLRKAIVDNVTTVTVTCVNEDEAAAIFETLNDRGLGLSTVDLLRNLVLRRAGESDREEVLNIWGEILSESLSVDVEDFLRHYWTSRHGDIKSQRLYRAIRGHLKNNAGPASLEFMRDLRDAHQAYVRLLRPDFDNREMVERLYDVADIKAKMLYPLFLACLNKSESHLPLVVQFGLTFYVRQIVIARQSGSKSESTIYAAAKYLWDTGDVAGSLAWLYRAALPDGSFADAVSNLKNLDTAHARYLLRGIEINRRATEEVDVARQPRIHIEHIYPQKPREGFRWDKHSEYVGMLGNLTLLSRRINVTIKNAPFDIKRHELAKSELHLTVEVAKNEEWTPAKVTERQAALAEEIKGLWSWPVEVIDEVRLAAEDFEM
ncbi:DUF262 domain-containing protein [Microbispora rosea]